MFSCIEEQRKEEKLGAGGRGQIIFLKNFYIYLGSVGSSLLVAMSQGYSLVAVCRFLIAVTSRFEIILKV